MNSTSVKHYLDYTAKHFTQVRVPKPLKHTSREHINAQNSIHLFQVSLISREPNYYFTSFHSPTNPISH